MLKAYWVSAAVVVAAYVFLFLARRDVSLRPVRVGVLLLVVAAVRLGLIVLGVPLEGPDEFDLTLLLLGAGAVLCLFRRMLLLRVDGETLRSQVETACAGLFIGLAEPRPGLLQLTAKGGTWPLRVVRLSRRVQLVGLPSVVGPGKVRLFVHWLCKQYPGPVPRIHIVLKQE